MNWKLDFSPVTRAVAASLSFLTLDLELSDARGILRGLLTHDECCLSAELLLRVTLIEILSISFGEVSREQSCTIELGLNPTQGPANQSSSYPYLL